MESFRLHPVIFITNRANAEVMQSHPSVCFYSNFWTEWPLGQRSKCMCATLSLPHAESGGTEGLSLKCSCWNLDPQSRQDMFLVITNFNQVLLSRRFMVGYAVYLYWCLYINMLLVLSVYSHHLSVPLLLEIWFAVPWDQREWYVIVAHVHIQGSPIKKQSPRKYAVFQPW